MSIACDDCGKDCTGRHLTEVNPEGGFGKPRFLMCDECLAAAPAGSYAAEVRETVMRRPAERKKETTWQTFRDMTKE